MLLLLSKGTHIAYARLTVSGWATSELKKRAGMVEKIMKCVHRSPKHNMSNGELCLKYKSLYGDQELTLI